MRICGGDARDVDEWAQLARMEAMLVAPLKSPPVLDTHFTPAVLWNRAYRALVAQSTDARRVALALEQPGGDIHVSHLDLLPDTPAAETFTRRYVERWVKFLLWQHGGSRLWIGGAPELARFLASVYAPSGAREFDDTLVGRKIYLEPLSVRAVAVDAMPAARQAGVALGRHLAGCRIGFDLGGSDRKTAAVIDGKVVFTEEVGWDPYFQSDPNYHLEGVRHSLRRAAEHLPRVDAIGGSAAGCYVQNEVRAASLFRGVGEEDFARQVRGMFSTLRAEWGNVPFAVVNDGEVTALAGSMSLGKNAVLGISMGTSMAAGYVDPAGRITNWLNELAFAPIDYQPAAPVDEWSGDGGCGVQYFSQQAVARLATSAGLNFPKEMPLAERLVEVQTLMAAGSAAAEQIYQTIGTYFGYALAHYAEFMAVENVLVLGRVTSGAGGEVILQQARTVLAAEFPEFAQLSLSMPDEQMKRHGQAVAAASLAAL
jgi:predicted NBD/HSP70 family sugar kinase